MDAGRTDTIAAVPLEPIPRDPHAARRTPEVVIIAAVAEANRLIGDGLKLPWHLPEDLKRFKAMTLGHPILMGRRTFESLVQQFGGPLKKRRNLVLTTSGATWPQYPHVETYASIGEALAAVQEEERLFIGGGAAIYEQFLEEADRMELTLVEGTYEGDTFFPAYEHLIGRLYEVEDEDPRDGYRFVTYRRIGG